MSDGGKLTFETKTLDVGQDFAQHHPGIKMGRYASLSVSDTGIGMDERTMERVFEPFFTTKEAGKGTGLGLASTYGIVKQSSGHISVSSEPGKGTVFEIYLPLVEEPAQSPVKVDKLSVQEQKRGTVLVVEDTSGLRQVTREFLEEVGYDVLEADGGERALQVAATHEGPIILMVTDVVMRGMSGHVLAQRPQSSRPDARVLYVSRYADSVLLRCGVRPSALNFLHKPYTQIELANKIQEVLNTTT